MSDITTQDLFTVLAIGVIGFTGNWWAAGFMAASFAAGKLLAPDAPSLVSNAAGRNVNVRGSIETRKIIYGTSSIGGNIVYATSSGNRHQFLHLVICLADHESEAIEKVYFNEEDANSETFHKLVYPNARIWFDPAKIESNGDNPNLNNVGNKGRGVFVDFSNTNDPEAQGHGYYYITNSEDTDVREDFLQVDKISNLPFESQEIHEYCLNGPTCIYPDLYVSFRRLNKHLGEPGQVADADLIIDDPTGEWDSACTLDGITYLVASLTFDPNKFPTGIPNVLSIVKGKKVYNPKEDPSIPEGNPSGTHRFYDSSTWEWSDNWALCVLDYLKCPTYGLNLDIDDLDWNSVVSAINICDEQVEISPGEIRSRYSANGVLDSGASFSNNMETLLTAAEGRIAFTQGTYKIYPAVYNVPSGDILDEKDLSGDLQVRASTPRSELFNVTEGIFIDKDALYVATSFPRFPPIDANNIYELEDGQEIVKDIELPFTTDVYQAQMLAKIVLETSRQNIVVNFPANVKALQYSLWQTVLVGAKSLGWGPIDTDETNPYKEFRITNIEIAASGQVTMAMREETKTMYDWDITKVTEKDSAPATGLPSPLFSAPPSFIYPIDTTEIFVGIDGSIQASINATWTDNANYTSFFEVEYKKALTLTEDVPWKGWGTVTVPNITISPVVTSETYYVRVRAVSSIGVRSEWEVSEPLVIVGSSAPPSAVQNFYVRVQADGTREYSWEHTSREVDVTGYIIKYILQNDLPVPYDLQNEWDNNMTPLHNGYITESPFELNRPEAGDYVFAIAAIDSSEVEGPPIKYKVSLPDPRTKNSIFSSDEALREAGFPGYKVGCFTADRVLYPASTGSQWSDATTWEDLIRWDAGNVTSPFTYWTGDNDDITLSANSKLGAIDLGANVSFTPNSLINTEGISDIATVVTWYYWEDGVTTGSWSSTTSSLTAITARWIKAKFEFTVSDSDIAQVNEISIELTGDLVEETLEDLDISAMRGDSNFAHLFPDSVSGRMKIPYTRPFKHITHVSVSVRASGAATSTDIENTSLATAGPQVRVFKWNGSTFVGSDERIDVFIRGV